MERYFVDRRVGSIAVRDREFTDPTFRGLYSDTPGVVKYWIGTYYENCGKVGWDIPVEYEEEALFLCKELNETL